MICDTLAAAEAVMGDNNHDECRVAGANAHGPTEVVDAPDCDRAKQLENASNPRCSTAGFASAITLVKRNFLRLVPFIKRHMVCLLRLTENRADAEKRAGRMGDKSMQTSEYEDQLFSQSAATQAQYEKFRNENNAFYRHTSHLTKAQYLGTFSQQRVGRILALSSSLDAMIRHENKPEREAVECPPSSIECDALNEAGKQR